MTTNNPDVVMTLPGGEQLVRLSDYEALQAERSRYKNSIMALTVRCCSDTWIKSASDKELDQYLSDGIAQLQAECEKLRKDAEFGRSVLSKREPGKVYGCHCDLEEGMEPDGCVIDSNEHLLCNYATHIEVKEQCSYWRVIASDAAMQGDQP